MNLRRLLLRLRLADGISIRGENRIYNWLQAHPNQAKHLLPNQLATIAELTDRHRVRFCAHFVSQQLSERVQQHVAQLSFITILDKAYPAQLREGYLPPIVLFYQGDISLLQADRLLAVIGARDGTGYAQRALEQLIPPLISQQVVVVSGLARGVDSLGHRVTLKSGGRSIGVIGTGLDRVYPGENRRLQTYMAEHELVISEYGLGAVGKPHHFVERNRIIAGLVQALLVVQAKARSGSLITANLALQNNRNVLALPGRVDDPLSVGCNELILVGAKPVLTAIHVLEELPELSVKTRKPI